MTGKNKCKILKEIRQKIADNNDIEFITNECTYKGECTGTCPKCEEELRYLEAELLKRKNAGKSIAVAGLAAVMLAASGCANEPIQSHTVSDELSSFSSCFEEKTQGVPVMPAKEDDSFSSEEKTMGKPSVGSEDYNSIYELEGDVAYPSESSSEATSTSSITSSTTSSDSSPLPEVTRGVAPVPRNDDAESTDDYNMDYFLELSKNEQEAFLSIFLREEIKEIWSNYKYLISLKTKGKTDTYVATLDKVRYKVVISYDKNGFCTSFKTTKLTEETTS